MATVIETALNRSFTVSNQGQEVVVNLRYTTEEGYGISACLSSSEREELILALGGTPQESPSVSDAKFDEIHVGDLVRRTVYLHDSTDIEIKQGIVKYITDTGSAITVGNQYIAEDEYDDLPNVTIDIISRGSEPKYKRGDLVLDKSNEAWTFNGKHWNCITYGHTNIDMRTTDELENLFGPLRKASVTEA